MFTRQSCLRSKATDLCRTAAQTGVSVDKTEMTHSDRTILPANHICSSETPTQLMSTTKAIFIVKILYLPLLEVGVDAVQIDSSHQSTWKRFVVTPTTPLHEVFLLLAVICWDEHTQWLTLPRSLHQLCRAWKLMSVFVLFGPGIEHCYLQLHSLAMPPVILTCTHSLLNPSSGSSCSLGTTVQVVQKNTSIFIILLWLLCERAWKGINSPETNCFMNYSDANVHSKAFLLC